MKTTDEPIVVQQSYPVDQATLWNAISQVEHLQQWFFEQITDFKPEVGHETRFDVTTEEGVRFPHVWQVTESDSPERLRMKWFYEGYDGVADVCFEILSSNNDSSSELRVTAIAVEDFSQDVPEFLRESAVAGWNFLVKESLKDYLDQ